MSEILWMFIGSVIMAVFLAYVPGSVIQKYHKAIDVCEAELPGNQQCMITAIPETKETRR